MLRTLKNKELEEIKWKLIGIFGKLFIDLLFSTIQVEIVGMEKVKDLIESRRGIAAIWHSRILLFSYLFKGWNAAILVSRSKDGEIIARLVERQGHEPVRGSTSKRGLRALSKLIKSLKAQTRTAVIIPDGPQGPRFKVQPGVVMLAKKTGYPVVPMTYSARRAKIFASWDRFVLPYPFTRCRLVYGEPIYVPADTGREIEEKYRQLLELELCRITTLADRSFGHTVA